MKILIVDDDTAIRIIVKYLVKRAGFRDHEFAEASDGTMAYQEICEWQPDLVLCSWLMPGTSGIELMQKLRADGNQVPFGFMSAMANEKEAKIAADNGALFLIKRPFTVATLQSKLQEFVSCPSHEVGSPHNGASHDLPPT